MSDGSGPSRERGSERAKASDRTASVRRDPMAAILALGERQVRTGALLGLAGALIVHGAGAAQAVSSMIDMAAFVTGVRVELRERLRSQYDIEVAPPEPEPEPEPEPQPEAPPEPEPEPAVKAPLDKAPEPDTTPPPAAAEAANVLAAEPDPNAPLDLTGNTFVVGSGETYAGGITASTGTSKSAVRDVRAAPTGVGKAPAAAAISPGGAPAADLSRKPAAIGDWGDSCPFPEEANAEGVNRANVILSVTVTSDGRVQSATVATDPGNGFGRAARQCALRYGRFSPALDSAGQPVTKTVPLRMRFSR